MKVWEQRWALWSAEERELVEAGLSRRAAHQEIAERYEVAPSTVYLALTETARARRREYLRNLRSYEARRASQNEASQRWRKTPEGRMLYRLYLRRYRQALRGIGECVAEVEDGGLVALRDVKNLVKERYGIQLGDDVLRGHLDGIDGSAGYLVRISDSTYFWSAFRYRES